MEEWIGKDQCTITLHNLRHITEDIRRFGHPDNYWCWAFERCVKKYKKISHNHKNAERSFANTESRRETLKLHYDTREINLIEPGLVESEVYIVIW